MDAHMAIADITERISPQKESMDHNMILTLQEQSIV
jgi:hypothetical protein